MKRGLSCCCARCAPLHPLPARQDTRSWVDMPTLALALDDSDHPTWHRQGRRAGGGRRKGAAGEDADGEEDFYSLLGVPRDASPELIKKQYYILARR